MVVVGAGLAGLTAAAELERAGWEVEVLEARNRLGGRVHTFRFPSGQHAEAGGEAIDSHHTAMIETVRRYGLELEDTRRRWGGLEELVFHNGRREPFGQFRGGGANARQLRRYWSALYEPLDQVSVSEPGAGRGPELDRVSMAEFLDRLRISGHARFLIEVELVGDYGVELRELSLLCVLLAEKVAWDQPNSGVEAFRIRGGNSRLVEAIARALSGRVRTGSPVIKVEQGATGVSASIAGGEVVEADQCVLAMPLPALRRIEVRPALNRPLAEAVATLGYATSAKTVLDCRRRFWRERGFSGDVFSDLALGDTWEATDQQPGRRGVLITYTGGNRGAAAARRSGRERIAVARRDLCRVFPGSAPLLENAASVAWAGERYSGGCWVNYRPGEVVPHWPALHQSPSDGRIHLAGEHVERLTGYMESAVRSGRSVAERVRAY